MTEAILNKPLPILIRLCLFFTAVICSLCILVTAAKYVILGQDKLQEWAMTRWKETVQMVTKVEYIKEYVSVPEMPIEQLVEKAAKDNKVPTIALQAIVYKESANGQALYRFEPKLYEKFLNSPSMKKFSTDEIRQLASSHGVGHVLGATAQVECGIHWSKLYDPAIGIDCAAKYLRKKVDELSHIKDPSQKLWQAFHNYNSGSSDRGGSDADAYADNAMSWVGKKLYAKLSEEMK